jgi:hypothetical protein
VPQHDIALVTVYCAEVADVPENKEIHWLDAAVSLCHIHQLWDEEGDSVKHHIGYFHTFVLGHSAILPLGYFVRNAKISDQKNVFYCKSPFLAVS